MTLFEPTCLWPLAAELGEGPLWLADEQRLYFVDIKGRHLHCCDAQGQQRQTWSAPQPISFVQPIKGGGLIAGLKDGLYRFYGEDFRFLRAVEPHRPCNRLNDAYTDPQGRLWFGSMDDGEVLASGSLYRLGASGMPLMLDHGYVITNGPCMSPDGRTLYHTDTLERVIHAFDVSPQGELANRRVLARISDGYPDGTTIDSAGHLWTCLFGGSRIERRAPGGELLQTVRLPCANVTKLAFGGPDLCTAFVTTAWKGLSITQRAEQPLAGGLFTFRTDVPGLPQHPITQGF